MRNYRFLTILSQSLIIAFLLFWWPYSTIPFEIPKVNFLIWAIRCGVLLFIWNIVRQPKNNWKPSFLMIVLTSIYIIWAFITSYFGMDFAKSFNGNMYRMDGLLVLISLAIGGLVLNYFWKGMWRIYLSQAVFVGNLILSVNALYKISIGTFGIGNSSTFGNPVFLAGYLAVSMPFIIYLYKELKNEIYMQGALLCALAIFFIDASGATIALLIYIILYAFYYTKSKLKYFVIPIATIYIIFISLGLIKNFKDISFESFTAEGRPRIFMNLWRGFVKKPIIGYGWANVDYVIRQESWPIKLNDDVYIDKAHSEIVESFVTTGIVGGVIYLLILGSMGIRLFKNLKKKGGENWNFAILSIFLLYVFHSQTNVISIAEVSIFWFLVSLCL